jgi:hypothetical protein
MVLSCLLQTVLVFQVPAGGPVRFGWPLPEAVLQQGLRLQGQAGAALQWRPLQEQAEPGRRIWCEIAVTGARGRCTLVTGGDGPSRGAGPAFTLAEERDESEQGFVLRRIRSWRGGGDESCERLQWIAPGVLEGETFATGEALTRPDPAWTASLLRAEIARREYEVAGLLPPDVGLGHEVRRRLLAVMPLLVELPGVRGAGDFGRSGGVVTNLEFDTTLALLRLGLASGRKDLVALAFRCARHTVDRDLDRNTGLPFPHGPEHRTGVPEVGHAWLQGLLLAGCLSADDDLIATAGGIARALAASPPRGQGKHELLREYAWPLLEMEAWLAFRSEPAVARAADRLAAAILQRWDPELRTFRFGEAGRGPEFLERGWLTGGILLPALRAWLHRHPDRVAEQHVVLAERQLAERAQNGLPTHWFIDGGVVQGEHREVGDPRAWLMLEGLSLPDLRGLLGRPAVVHALGAAPRADDPDLATSVSMIARCWWIYR